MKSDTRCCRSSARHLRRSFIFRSHVSGEFAELGRKGRFEYDDFETANSPKHDDEYFQRKLRILPILVSFCGNSTFSLSQDRICDVVVVDDVNVNYNMK